MSRNVHSDSDSSINSNSDSESSEEENARQPKPGKGVRQKKVYPPIEFAEAWERVKAVEREIQAKTIKFAKPEWKQIIPAIEKEALTNGFGDEELETLWRVIRTSGSFINIKDRRDLIFLLVPKTQIRESFVKKMCLWTVSSMHSSPKVNAGTATRMLKYFHGLVEYSLIDGNCFGSQYLYTTLFTLSSHSELVESLFVLLKKITTKDNFQRFHVTLTLQKWKQTYTPSHKRAVHDILKKYKVLHPDYLPENVFGYHARGKSKSKTKSLENLRKLLYEAKRRTHGMEARQMEGSMVVENRENEPQDEFDPQNLHNNKLFSELVHSFDNYSLKDFVAGRIPIGPKVVSWALLDTERVVLFATNDDLLELFESFLTIALEHKFPQYNGSDVQKYVFLLDRSIQVCMLLRRGLSAFDEWLPDFLLEWDMVLWRKQILQLLTYLNPLEFTASSRLMFRKLEMDFLLSKITNGLEIWNALTQLLSRWLEQLNVLQNLLQQGNEEDDEDRKLCQDSACELYKLILGFMNKYITHNVGNKLCEPMIFQMIQTFTELSIKFNQKRIPCQAVPPISLLYCVILLDSTRLFDAFSEFLNSTSRWNLSTDEGSILDSESVQRLKIFRSKLKSFFGSGLAFGELFSREFDELPDDEATQYLQECVSSWTHESSQALGLFRSRSTNKPGTMDFAKMQQLAPNLAEYYNSIRKADFFPLHASTPAATVRRRLL